MITIDGFVLDGGQHANGAEENKTLDLHQAYRLQEIDSPGYHNIKGYLRHSVKIGNLQRCCQVCNLADLVFLDCSEQLWPILNAPLLIDYVRLVRGHHPFQFVTRRGAYIVVDHLITVPQKAFHEMASNEA